MDSDNRIEFKATVYKVQTLVDNGIRVTLDLSEDYTAQMSQLAECQRWGDDLTVVISRLIGRQNGRQNT